MLLLWWVITDGNSRIFISGLPVVVITTLACMKLMPAKGPLWSLKGLLHFVPFFIHQSLQGGADVAGRALHPGLPLAPAVLDYSMRLPEGPARAFMACVVNLLPGTLSAELKGGDLRVHVIDEGLKVEQKLRVLEERVAELFALNSGIRG